MTPKTYLAHRGNWHNKHIENTIRAFEETRINLNQTLQGFECDLRQLNNEDPSSWVIFHDDTMTRFNKNQTTIDPNKNLKSNNTMDQIPKLIDFCQWVEQLNEKIMINIEIKTGSSAGIQYLIQSLTNANQKNHASIIYSSLQSNIMMELCNNSSETIGILIKTVEELATVTSYLQNKKRVAFIAITFENNTKEIMTRLSELTIPIGIYFSSLTSFKTHIDDVEKNPLVDLIFVEK